MDIRPPRHPITSLREFLFEIFTVTCGILIALGLEGVIQHGRERHLRRKHKTTSWPKFPPIATRSTKIQNGASRLAHHPFTPPHVLGRDFTPLPSDAWQTALATQGIAQLNHATASALSTAYDEQAAFNSLQERALNEWLEVAAFGDFNADSDEAVQLALQHLRICYGLAVSLTHVDQQMEHNYAVAQQALR